MTEAGIVLVPKRDRHGPQETNPSADWRRESLAQALEVCQDPARKACLQLQMANAYFQAGLHANALWLLGQIRPQTAAPVRDAAARLRGLIEQAQKGQAAAATQQQAQREQARRAGLRRVLQERLAQAQKQGDQATAARIQASLEQLK